MFKKFENQFCFAMFEIGTAVINKTSPSFENINLGTITSIVN